MSVEKFFFSTFFRDSDVARFLNLGVQIFKKFIVFKGEEERHFPSIISRLPIIVPFPV